MTPLVDTNVLSELARSRPDRGVLAWAADVSSIAVSAITVEEIAYGLSWRANPRVEGWFAEFFASRCDVLPVTEPVARRAGWLRGQLRGQGESRTQADMLIAGTAQLFGLVLVTRNERDFAGCGIPVLNPFSA